MDAIPPLSVDLIDLLDRLYPPLSSKDLINKDLIEIRSRAQQRLLIDRLLHLKDQTINDDLGG